MTPAASFIALLTLASAEAPEIQETSEKPEAATSESSEVGDTSSPPVPASQPPPPSGGAGAVGGAGHVPLPPPPPPVDPSTIRPGPWRGVAWVNLGVTIGGKVGGSGPAATTVVAVGGTGEIGIRATNWLGIAMAFSRHAHDQLTVEVTYPDGTTANEGYRGYMTNLDIAVFRFFAPVPGRVQPWFDVGAGLAFLEPPRSPLEEVGLAVRGTAGVDFWLARQLTLTTQLGYRADVLRDSDGHALRGGILMGAHW